MQLSNLKANKISTSVWPILKALPLSGFVVYALKDGVAKLGQPALLPPPGFYEGAPLITCYGTPDGIWFSITLGSGESMSDLVKMDALTQAALKQGTASVLTKKMCAKKIEKCVQGLHKQVPGAATAAAPDAPIGGPTTQHFDLAKSPLVTVPLESLSVQKVTKTEIQSLNTQPMLDAPPAMYFPVNGTSPTSRYFLVGLYGAGKKVRMAVRLLSATQLSIRVEGSENDVDLATIANQAQLSFGSGQGHYSVHLEPSSVEEAARCVGSVAGVLSLHLGSHWPMPSLWPILGEGSK